MSKIARRDFLKAASAAVSCAATATGAPPADAAQAKSTAKLDPKISGTPYTPALDYPIRPTRHSEVTVADSFWKPKIITNAEVTIPFEVQKLSETPRGFAGNVLEAAILSLQTRPDPQLQAQVDTRIQQMKAARGGGNN